MQHINDVKQLRSFGLLVGGIFAIIGLWPSIWYGEDVRLWSFVLAGILILPALIFPRSLQSIYRLWMALGNILGWINTRIILSVMFYGVFTPLGLAMRFLGKDSMLLKIEPEADTYRIMRQQRSASHMQRQF